MPLYWDLIIGPYDHKETLTELYKTRSVEVLAEYLGVSEGALFRKFKKEGVKTRPKGQPSKLMSLNNEYLRTYTPKEIAKATGTHVRSVHRHLRRLKGIKDD